MFYYYFGEFLPLILTVLGIYLISNWLHNRKTKKLVLKSIVVQEKANDDLLVQIIGRASGIIGFLLTLFGIGDTIMLRITKKEVEFKASSLSGQENSLMSLASLSSVHCGYHRSILLIILMVIIGIASLIFAITLAQSAFTREAIAPVFIIGGIIIFILWLIYHFSKNIRIMVQGRGGAVFGLAFSPSLIEGVNIDIKQAEKIITLVNQYVIAAQTGKPITTTAYQEDKEVEITEEDRKKYADILSHESDEELKAVIRDVKMYDATFVALAKEELQERILGRRQQRTE